MKNKLENIILLNSKVFLKNLGLSDSISLIEKNAALQFKKIFKEKTTIISLDKINAEINKKIKSIKNSHIFYLSNDINVRGDKINVCRFFDIATKTRFFGSRSGEALFKESLFKNNEKNKKEAALVDVGFFSGITGLFVINELKKRGIIVKEIICGVITKQALEVLKKNVNVKYCFLCEDWIETSDLLGISGQWIGYNGKLLKLPRIKRIYSPYFLFIRNKDRWFNLPDKKINYAKRINFEFLLFVADKIRQDIGKELTVGDFGLPVEPDMELSELKKYDYNMPLKKALHILKKFI